MFARMENIKLGKMFEDDTTNINDVEKALSLVDIKIRDSANSFRDMGDVFDEVAQKWSTMNELEQSAVANAIAGVRQRENFLTLMTNYNQVLEAQTLQTEAAGLANERYGIYLDSIEAKMNKFQAAWEKLWMKTISSDSIKGFVSVGTAIMNIIDALGGLVPVLGVVLGLTIAFKSVQIAKYLQGWVKQTKAVIAANKAMGLSFNSVLGWIGLVIAALTIIIQVIDSIPNAVERLEKTTEKISEISSKIDSLKTNKQTVADLSDEFNELSKNTKKSTEEQKRFVDIQNQLKDLLPEIAGYYDQSGNFVISNEALTSNQTYLDYLNKQIEAEKELLFLQTKKEIKQGATVYEQNLAEIQKIQTALNRGETRVSGKGGRGMSVSLTQDEIDAYRTRLLELQGENSEFVKNTLLNWGEFSDEQRKILRGIIEESGDFGKELSMIFAESMPIDRWAQDWKEGGEDVSGVIDDLAGRMKQLSDAIKTVGDAEKEQSENGELSFETMQKLIDAGLVDYLYQQNGAWKLNTQAMIGDTTAALNKILIEQGLINVLAMVANGEYATAYATLAAAKSRGESVDEAMSYIAMLQQLSTNLNSSASGSASLSSAQEEEIKSYEKLIDSGNKRKDNLKKQLDAYKDIIEAKKESLRLEKEERDYEAELKDKKKNVTEIESQLLEIQTDNSEEGKARRLELEQEYADAKEELDQFQADRSYEIQIDALDAEYDAFEKYINKQMDMIDILIKKWEALAQAIKDALSQSGGGGIGNPKGNTSLATYDPATQKELTKKANEVTGKAQASSISDFYTRFSNGGAFKTTPSAAGDNGIIRVDADEIGMVLNRTQQNAIVSNPLTSMFAMLLGGASPLPRFNTNSTNNNGGLDIGGISIVVQGNLDKSFDIDAFANRVVDKVNTKLNQRGFTKSANQTIS